MKPPSVGLKFKNETLRRIFKNKKCVFGAALVAAFILIALLAPLIAGYPPDVQDLSQKLQPPSSTHLLGTDILGRDLFSRIVYGAQLSILIATLAVALALIVSVPLGLVSGYYGGMPDQIIMRFTDIFMAFPSILLAVLLIGILGAGLNNLIIAIGLYMIPGFIRLIRSSTLAIKEEEFIMAARAIGEKNSSIIFRYVLPSVLPIIVVQSTLRMGISILTAAGLGFLGIGVQPPLPEWGLMTSEARGFILIAPTNIIFPGLAIMFFTLGFNFFGDGLNDVLNPRLKED
jgi:peptide/nickel transport system permease protein